MRVRRRWSPAAWTALGGWIPLACVDLFHSTADIRTACEIDASACAGDAGAPSAGGSSADLCVPADQAARNASHACAWLGACFSPMGNNAFGPCMVQALLAFDCAANPNHLARGVAAQAWACLAHAQNCTAVQRCVFPNGPPPCSESETTACGGADGGGVQDTAVRIECSPSSTPARVGAENCVLWGETCLRDGGSAVCGENAAGLVCDGSVRDDCTDTEISWCGPSGQSGIDCTGNGEGLCGVFGTNQPPNQVPWYSCIPDDAGDAAGCTPSLDVACDQGVAQSCPTGIPETIDCAALLGNPSACNASPLDPAFDWTSPCAVRPSQCEADTCDGSTLTGCARGASFSVDCTDQSLGPCEIVPTDLQTQQHAACAGATP